MSGKRKHLHRRMTPSASLLGKQHKCELNDGECTVCMSPYDGTLAYQCYTCRNSVCIECDKKMTQNGLYTCPVCREMRRDEAVFKAVFRNPPPADQASDMVHGGCDHPKCDNEHCHVARSVRRHMKTHTQTCNGLFAKKMKPCAVCVFWIRSVSCTTVAVRQEDIRSARRAERTLDRTIKEFVRMRREQREGNS